MTAGKYNHFKIRHLKEKRDCKQCEINYMCLPNSKQKFCSLICYHKSLERMPLSKKCYQKTKGFKGPHTEETKKQIRNKLIQYVFTPIHLENLKKSRRYQIRPVKDTTIEIIIQDFIKELKIEFLTHQYMKIEHGYQCDIFIPSMNLIIECDGDYWHNYPEGREIDHIRTKELLSNGLKVLRLWERDIRKINIKEFEEIIGNKFENPELLEGKK